MKKYWIIPIIIVVALIITAVILGRQQVSFSISNENQPDTITTFNDEGLISVEDGGIIETSNPLAFINPSSCPTTNQFRANDKEGLNGGTTVYGYGSKCSVGERIIMYACSGPSNNPGSCNRLFDDDYVKISSNDRINLLLECGAGANDGITNCYQRSWYTNRINNKYVGYDCISCNSNPEVGSVKILNVEANPSTVIVGEPFIISGELKIIGGDVHNAVVESGTSFYGNSNPLSITSSVGVCGDDLTVGARFNGDQGETISFELTDTVYTTGNYEVPVYVVSNCHNEGGNEVYDTKTFNVNIIADETTPPPEEPLELITCYWCEGEALIVNTESIGPLCPIGTSPNTLTCTDLEIREDNPGPPPEDSILTKPWFIAGSISLAIILLASFWFIIRRGKK